MPVVSFTADTLRAAGRPTFYFIGVTTGSSSIQRVFPAWAAELGLDAQLRGIDLPLHASVEAYRRVVEFIRDDPQSLGALVTTHKIDLYRAAHDLFDECDYFSTLMGETSCISKQPGTVRLGEVQALPPGFNRFGAVSKPPALSAQSHLARSPNATIEKNEARGTVPTPTNQRTQRLICHAKDPISSGLALDAFIPAGYWTQHPAAQVVSMGAGGSTIAISWHLSQPARGADRPARIIVTNRSQPRLDHAREVHRQMATDTPFEYVLAPTPADNDQVVGALPAGSLVINATGLGKDAAGSPLTDAAIFPENGLVWELNYRGDLIFLNQARAQAGKRNLRVEDGWIYFIHGWTQVIAEVFHRQIPTSGPAFDRLCEIARTTR